MTFETILVGLGAGITYSLTAWGKKENQKFDITKFGTTVLIGAAVGIVGAIVDLPISTVNEFAISVGMVPIVENTIKFVWRKYLKRFFKKEYS